MDAICFINGDGKLVRLGPESHRLWGYEEEELVGRAFVDLIDPEDAPRAATLLDEAQKGRPTTGFETRCFRSDGTPIITSWTAYWSELEQLLFCVIHDITERKSTEAMLWHHGNHDPLTDLPNRSHLVDRLNQAMALARRNRQTLAVLSLDLDRFKLVNESLGPSAGDLLLIDVSQRLLTAVRVSDTVARVSGDEFTILLSQVTQGPDAA